MKNKNIKINKPNIIITSIIGKILLLYEPTNTNIMPSREVSKISKKVCIADFNLFNYFLPS